MAKDVATALGYTEPHKAASAHCKHGKLERGISSLSSSHGGSRFVTIIPEFDVYRLIFRSKLPAAERFESWVMEEVLPAIRKTGGYLVAARNETPEAIMARAVLVAQDTIKRIEAEKIAAEERTAELERTKAHIGSKREATCTRKELIRRVFCLDDMNRFTAYRSCERKYGGRFGLEGWGGIPHSPLPGWNHYIYRYFLQITLRNTYPHF